MRIIVALLLICFSALAVGQGNDYWLGSVPDNHLDGTAWVDAGEEYGLDPWLLYAISLEESNVFDSETKTLFPWPYSIHYQSHQEVYESRSDAVARIQELEAQGKVNYDIGPMQINRRWNGQRVDHPEDLLDVGTSISVSAAIISENLALTPGDPELAIGRYRSWNTDLAREYAQRIFEVRLQLPGGLDAYELD